MRFHHGCARCGKGHAKQRFVRQHAWSLRRCHQHVRPHRGGFGGCRCCWLHRSRQSSGQTALRRNDRVSLGGASGGILHGLQPRSLWLPENPSTGGICHRLLSEEGLGSNIPDSPSGRRHCHGESQNSSSQGPEGERALETRRRGVSCPSKVSEATGSPRRGGAPPSDEASYGPWLALSSRLFRDSRRGLQKDG